ncbi:MAG: hypothetical protein ACR2GY_07420 [Phycisphaerales bacterium]
MSTIGSNIETSLIQTAAAQQQAAKARDKERARRNESAREADSVELRVAGVEDAEAIRALPENDSEQAESEHRHELHDQPRKRNDNDADEAPPHIDVTG